MGGNNVGDTINAIHTDGRNYVLTIQTYLVDADVPFLFRRRTLELCVSRLDTRRRILKMKTDRAKKEFKMVTIGGNHYGLVLETKGRTEVDIIYLEDQEKDLTSFKAVRKV